MLILATRSASVLWNFPGGECGWSWQHLLALYRPEGHGMDHEKVVGPARPGDELRHQSEASAPIRNSPSSVATRRMALATSRVA